MLVGSHNWAGQAHYGNNLEAIVHLRGSASDPFAVDSRHHLDACLAESELFDRSKLNDYRAIQVALHGCPTRDN